MQLFIFCLFLFVIFSSNIIVFCEESLIVICFIAFVFSLYISIEKQQFHQNNNLQILEKKTSFFSLLMLRTLILQGIANKLLGVFQLALLSYVLERVLFNCNATFRLFTNNITISANFFFTELNQAFLSNLQRENFSFSHLRTSLFLVCFELKNKS